MDSGPECSSPPPKKSRVESMELEPSVITVNKIASFLESVAASAEPANDSANDAVAAEDLANTTHMTKANKDIFDAANNIIMAAGILHKAAVVIKKVALS